MLYIPHDETLAPVYGHPAWGGSCVRRPSALLTHVCANTYTHAHAHTHTRCHAAPPTVQYAVKYSCVFIYFTEAFSDFAISHFTRLLNKISRQGAESRFKEGEKKTPSHQHLFQLPSFCLGLPVLLCFLCFTVQYIVPWLTCLVV